MWEYFFPEEDDSQRRQVSWKSQFGLASTGFCLTSNAMGANQRSLLVRSLFLPSICLKSDGFWNELLKGDLLRFRPDVLWSQAETRATQTILSYILISTFFWGEKEVWRVSTSTGPRRTRRLSSGVDAVTSSSYSVRDHELPGKSATTVSTSTNVSSWQGLLSDNPQVSQVKHMHNLFFAYAYTIGNK